ncbi:rhodanese-related sulfurtransferase [Acetobacter estunensis]|uniref:oxygen-dependent tRNA uridine(34) hydroxylase TrhO n=1 Tax=Acetobacter estunensis TaxID=104097 RepID=UPI001C2D49FC|nr:rhodanese-related sulfurtransferase [Acetobacter estunensis]MBV1836657.1 rhodanese-related sulfurtransferase [Acetobacter estunensis]
MTDDTLLPVRVVALYRFTPFADHETLRQPLAKLCCSLGVKGTLLLAHEGINGTIAGHDDAMEQVLTHIRALPGCADLGVRESRAAEMPFGRMKVRLKREIVTMGEPDIDPRTVVGTYVEPSAWNALISDPDTLVIDTRNDYEVAVGTFRGAVDPDIATFREFPEWFRKRRDELAAQGRTPKVAMFCTGGIRCEKSTALAKKEGVDEVYHLRGGILNYLETIPEAESLWDGECFVFDKRVTVTHGLKQGQYDLCHACRRPISEEDKRSPLYEEGVSCPACHDERTDTQRQRYAAREQQMKLAQQRGE